MRCAPADPSGTDTAITSLEAKALHFPLDEPESDGTLVWDSVTMVLVEAGAGDHVGLGYTYNDKAAVSLIEGVLRDVVLGREALDVSGAWAAMLSRIRNLGRGGVISAAISAVDNALWDLKARILGLPLCRLLGMTRDSVPAYASGGFTSYDQRRLRGQLAGWAEQGFAMMKMKVGRDLGADQARVRAARAAIGGEPALFVDANGAYDRKQALAQAEGFGEQGVTWFEEPVTSDDLNGLRMIRDRAPMGMDIAAGEYGYDLFYFSTMLAAGAVDSLQIDATRCAGITTMLRGSALAQAAHIPISTHTAPAQHLHAACAVPGLSHVEWFHDHALIEDEVFEGVCHPVEGFITPDLDRPGNGLAIKRSGVERRRVA